MNQFINAVQNQSNKTLTENGSKTFVSSKNANVDLFFQIAALRGQKPDRLYKLFEAAYSEDRENALRIVQWARDVRGGAGERKIFRDLLVYIEKNYPNELEILLVKTPEIGRWDDILVVNEQKSWDIVAGMIRYNLENGTNEAPLLAKWLPRPKKGTPGNAIAERISKELGLSVKQYRKLVVGLTNVVETQMCQKLWDDIEFGKVPSLASIRYAKAFKKRAPVSYEEYLSRLEKGEDKVNAGAVYPYDVLKTYLQSPYDAAAKRLVLAQWEALPDYTDGSNILPMVDVSGSMSAKAGGTLSCMDIALSLGLYFSDKNKGPYKDTFLTFSSTPQIQTLKGDVVSKLEQLRRSEWSMSTDLDAAFAKVLDLGIKNNVKQKDMPSMVLVLSDMEFNAGYGSKTTSKRVKDAYKAAGYKVPKIVWWNIQSRQDNVPVKAGADGMALVSGFSPAIAKAILAGDLSAFTPENIMLKAISDPRYDLV